MIQRALSVYKTKTMKTRISISPKMKTQSIKTKLTTIRKSISPEMKTKPIDISTCTTLQLTSRYRQHPSLLICLRLSAILVEILASSLDFHFLVVCFSSTISSHYIYVWRYFNNYHKSKFYKFQRYRKCTIHVTFTSVLSLLNINQLTFFG